MKVKWYGHASFLITSESATWAISGIYLQNKRPNKSARWICS